MSATRLAGIVLMLFALGVPSGLGSAVSYTYDAAGRVTTAVYDNGTCVAYAYDASSNRTAQTNTIGAPATTPTWGSGTWGCFAWTP
jgi:YD repeat-containing protein